MSERQHIDIVQIGLVSDSALVDGSVQGKGWFRKRKSVKPKKSKADCKPDKVEESKADLKPDKIEESKADLKTVKFKKCKSDRKPKKGKECKAELNPKKVKEDNAELNVKLADNKKSDDTPKKDGLLTRARQWFTLKKAQHVSTRKEKKAAKKAAKKAMEQEAQTAKATIAGFTEEQMWAEIVRLESEITTLQDDHEVTEAEWRHLMVANVRRTRYLEKMKKDRAHSAILEEELAKVLWAQMDLDEKTLSLKQRFQLKIAKMSSKPKMVSAGTQTDGPSTEELYGSFLAYKEKVSKMKTGIVAQTDELEQLEREAEIRRKAENDLIFQTNIDIKKLQIKLEQLMCESKN